MVDRSLIAVEEEEGGEADNMARQVQPLRINKETPSKSPLKTTATAGASRALTEISSAEQRHNSPSLNLQTKVSRLDGVDGSLLNVMC